ncbi:DNA repair protein RecO (recombination protein O) [Chitinivorax tropicus]|uniref:DNA repair protein RecO n=1 Tax=Chitinivorax tropicus TaxID=714531 RepID=A0A840MNE1_9PROT|nr:DNA repair protein RecO [Chitinivorax tropicus]MBB5020158.1 DNA repair protein RecO (recombination protein O) [Chitinivorax tropicus]
MTEPRRVEGQPAFVLHTYPYRETSLIVEAFSRDHGRVAIVARGARRPKSAVRGVLMAFQPLLLSWFGKQELKTLHSAEWQGGIPQLSGLPLICGFYLNELLLNMLAREDAHSGLFANYFDTIQRLSCQLDPAPCLRRFELQMLMELGYGLDLTRTVDGQRVRAGLWYVFAGGLGLREDQMHGEGAVQGETLLAMAEQRFDQPQVLAQSKGLMRQAIQHALGDRQLYTRRLLRDLNQL